MKTLLNCLFVACIGVFMLGTPANAASTSTYADFKNAVENFDKLVNKAISAELLLKEFDKDILPGATGSKGKVWKQLVGIWMARSGMLWLNDIEDSAVKVYQVNYDDIEKAKEDGPNSSISQELVDSIKGKSADYALAMSKLSMKIGELKKDLVRYIMIESEFNELMAYLDPAANQMNYHSFSLEEKAEERGIN